MIKLFHVSKKPRLTTLIPSVPNHFMTSHLLEEGVTKRVSFAPSIQKCLRAVQSSPGNTYYVYVPTAIDKKYLRRASIYDVPDARLTGEYWYLRPVNVRLYAVIRSGKLYNPSVFRVGGIEARRPKDRPLFTISNDREYELLRRYNKNGKELTIKVALRNREPVPEKKGFFKRLFGRDSMHDKTHYDESLSEYSEKELRIMNAMRRRRLMEQDYDDEEFERELQRRKRNRSTKKKIIVPLLKGLLRIF